MKPARHLLLLILFFGLTPGCGSATLDESQIGIAQRVEGYDDVRNLFRDGSVYFAGQPQEAAFRRLAEDEGIKTVINTRRRSELENLGFDEIALIEELGMSYLELPFSYDSFSAEDVDRFAEILAATDAPVLVHCGSSNRVGGLWACYLALYRDHELEESIRLGKAAGLRSSSMIDAVRRVTGEK